MRCQSLIRFGAFVILILMVIEADVVRAASGGTCAGCVIVVGLFERMSMHLKIPLNESVSRWCSFVIPHAPKMATVCGDLLDVAVPLIAVDYVRKLPPDHTCQHTIPLCTDFPQCKLYNTWPPPSISLAMQPPTKTTSKLLQRKMNIKDVDKFEELFDAFSIALGLNTLRTQAAWDHFTDRGGVVDHLPEVDLDNDRYSRIVTLRGSDWRGKDCDGYSENIYPGRAINNFGPDKDHNCNGIFGVNEAGISYEEKFCNDTGFLGVISLGDSATAHFRVPPDWLNALTIDNTTYANLIPVLEDEFDWPQCSSSTGHQNSSICPPSPLAVNSIYLKLRERNRCNHRDFQNLGVNGARTSNYKPPTGSIIAMKTRNGTDQPALVVYAMIGNDVCSGHHDFHHMTNPDEFEENVITTMEWLDKRLKKGSHVAFMGLVDGRILYDTMHDIQHPIGAKYSDVYNYLNCVEVSPCWGWMNENETIRNMTSNHAALLNQRYPKIIQEQKYNNFDMVYIDTFSVLHQIVEEWVAAGHAASDLIEPTDGFHPSQTSNALLAKHIWDILLSDFPHVIGEENPNNQDIIRIFGDQGGY